MIHLKPPSRFQYDNEVFDFCKFPETIFTPRKLIQDLHHRAKEWAYSHASPPSGLCGPSLDLGGCVKSSRVRIEPTTGSNPRQIGCDSDVSDLLKMMPKH
mmetsp:Transcript_55864/g.116886  ORF Transcript_55864/g.116886 Transcript_55864/m.116886 type:complete len:100 (+) Transcript_55864:1467-1766(+)